jgi:hypothetical protein
MVIRLPMLAISGRYFRMSSSIDSLPSCASKPIEKAVNCFEIDATWKTERGVMATSYSRFDTP